ncbi:ammonium transporter [Pleomorphomonas koreensis]|uniref:ammonium transporter n=1 Tax=Pleomorphomonas koreensis TaxID=257440 RepID=UPI0003F8C378|nr:ammonium transporter [Pleomorphomonas koreensis]
MKHLKSLLAAAPALALMAAAAFAQDAVAPAVEAAAPVPVADPGHTAWVLTSTVLVAMMTVPALALFYGGLVRSKNVLSILMQCLIGFAVMAILWIVYGYSLAFTMPDEATALSPFIGTFGKAFLAGITPETVSGSIPEIVFVAFQMTFACITPALIVGASAERVKFGAVIFFLVLWFTFAYLPMAHMVWGGAGSYLGSVWGAIDFAGGTVVHINAGIAGLVIAIMGGKRIGLGRDNFAPHNLVLTYIGAMLLWIGWFGFNAGSELAADGIAGYALLNTLVATAAAAIAWPFAEWLTRGHASLLGGASGVVAGLVAITPACGTAGPFGAIVIGLAAGAICFWAATWVKAKFGYDDALDVFGVHGVGGIVGSILTGVFANPALGGLKADYAGFGTQVTAQVVSVIVCILVSGVVSVIALSIVKAIMGLRVTETAEREGLDITTHGERAYN